MQRHIDKQAQDIIQRLVTMQQQGQPLPTQEELKQMLPSLIDPRTV